LDKSEQRIGKDVEKDYLGLILGTVIEMTIRD
jgi:hypothetical protein